MLLKYTVLVDLTNACSSVEFVWKLPVQTRAYPVRLNLKFGGLAHVPKIIVASVVLLLHLRPETLFSVAPGF